MDKSQQIRRIIDGFRPEEQAVLSSKLERVLIRRKAIASFPSPAHLSQFLRPEFVQTPMLDAIDDAIIQANTGLEKRWIINTPPQRGKTSRMQDAALWMLLRRPHLNIVFASYEQGIASQSSLQIRQFIETHGGGYRGMKPDPYRVDSLGLMLDPDRAMATRWSLADCPDGSGWKPGGISAVGIGGALTGRPADCVAGDVTVVTEYGPLRADDAYRRAQWVLAHDHFSGSASWRRVEARRRIDRRHTVEVVTAAGRVITCTPDHRIYTGDGYTQARDLRPGQTLRVITGGTGMPMRHVVDQQRVQTSTDAAPTQWQTSRTISVDCAPHQRELFGQPGREPDRRVSPMSYDTPQVGNDTVFMVRPSGREPEPVYDFQVEGVRNFFAGGILAHNCVIVDDPIKDAKQADSEVYRKTIKNWFQSVVLTRLSKLGVVIVVQCMTGDTPVLRPDGTQTPLRDIRPGDQIATYEDGALAVSTVRNWANQGRDNVFAITMKSGAVVRANARHPFLVVDDEGREIWQRVADLKPGVSILRAGVEGGLALSALPTDVTTPLAPRDSVSPTTTAHVGRRGTDAEAPSSTGAPTFATVTASNPKTTIASLPSKGACAPFADAIQTTPQPPPTGTTSCALTTAMTRQRYADSSATTATSWSDAPVRRSGYAPELNTWNVTPDEVVEIVPAGVEDVFDLQVDHTENFIANGLVSHNTRWHEDDLAGWLLTNDHDSKWRHLNVPAQAKEHDPLGREPGEYLLDARGFGPVEWEQVKREVGSRTWFALYQGDPSPPEGGIFQRTWFDTNREKQPPELTVIITFVDPADNTGDGDEAGIITAGLDADNGIHVVADDSGHYTVSQWVRAALWSMLRHGASKLAYERSLSGLKRAIRAEWRMLRIQARELHDAHEGDTWPEEPDMGTVDAAVNQLADTDDTEHHRNTIRRQLLDMWRYVPQLLAMPTSGPPLKEITARGSKSVRASFVSPLYENGTVHHSGHFPTLEQQMATWLETQDSPDRMDALVHVVTLLNSMSGSAQVQGSRGTIPTRSRTAGQLTRSVPGRR